MFFYHEASGEMYVGGTEFVFRFDVDNNRIIEVGVEQICLYFVFCCFTAVLLFVTPA